MVGAIHVLTQNGTTKPLAIALSEVGKGLRVI
jgi:hypothetical protein